MDALLLDTDVFSYLGKRGHAIGALYQKHIKNKTVAISFVTVGEVLSGAKKRSWSAKRMAELHARLRSVVIVPFDFQICECYADLVVMKTSQGSDRVVAANDRWIASCAIRHRLPLVTNNQQHFVGIPGLHVISEAQPPPKPKNVGLPL